ncbi:DNA repair protein RadA [Hirschia baltica]|uniref:DNA repair protein RadA n=1 Tax=Hirschia baltica (strain ATCC 49814 / DSM 5838 / IFAM 1418) TaxID=582402 RepID=C6XKR5_HIRBI|nr:DNA repair protein RadA [Hirschia baltica]ACT59632.1 DNA repair protein RadA [Hirschia baltica ATCC 49814]
MAKVTTVFVCQSCGASYPKWNGKCEACNEWNTLVEETQGAPGGLAMPPAGKKRKAGAMTFDHLGADIPQQPRLSTNIPELDRVFGGGPAPSSAVLIGGDPGIGKSTLLLQAAASLADQGIDVVYVSGEEAVAQVQGRAQRLGVGNSPVKLASETDLRTILEALKTERPKVAVIDSVQTMWSDSLDAAPGSVGQVRACAQELTRYAKKNDCVMILVGHVTKDGQIAGPRVMEHMVDAVFYFEGERGHQYRILRAVKNRFGPTDEIGVFEMSENGLHGALDPSQLFLGGEDESVPGRAVFAAMEGSRPVLAEVQGLAGPQALGSPRRSVVGWDSPRLAMLLAVFETQCGLAFGARDVYLSVAGGYRISEPAGDLAAAAALASSAFDKPVPEASVFFGEVSLSGAIRSVGRMDSRLKEAARLGFERAFVPPGSPSNIDGMVIHEVSKLEDLLKALQNEAE